MGYHTTRYAGADRFGTALAVAAALGNPTTVMLVDGSTFADALAAGPAAAHVHAAVLLTNGSSLPAADAAYLAAHHGTVYGIGAAGARGRSGRDPGVRRRLVEQHECCGRGEILPGSDCRRHRDERVVPRRSRRWCAGRTPRRSVAAERARCHRQPSGRLPHSALADHHARADLRRHQRCQRRSVERSAVGTWPCQSAGQHRRPRQHRRTLHVCRRLSSQRLRRR